MMKVAATKTEWDEKASKLKIVDRKLLMELGLNDFEFT